jgi:hypothetical protein
MASGELLKKLFKSYKQRDGEGFYAAAMQIVAEEQDKNHNLLARELRGAFHEIGNVAVTCLKCAHRNDISLTSFCARRSRNKFGLYYPNTEPPVYYRHMVCNPVADCCSVVRRGAARPYAPK